MSTFLSVFYDATLRYSASRYITYNSFVHEIFGTRLLLANRIGVDNEGMRKMTTNMMIKYDKYYRNIDNINILVFVVILLEPSISGIMLIGLWVLHMMPEKLLSCH